MLVSASAICRKAGIFLCPRQSRKDEKRMKTGKLFMGLAGCALLLLSAGCGKRPPQEDPAASPQEETELTVFAAASLTETLTQLGERYTEEHNGVEIVFNFDSSV